jgi:hypothetical protein
MFVIDQDVYADEPDARQHGRAESGHYDTPQYDGFRSTAAQQVMADLESRLASCGPPPAPDPNALPLYPYVKESS